jgi:hypothetical protein
MHIMQLARQGCLGLNPDALFGGRAMGALETGSQILYICSHVSRFRRFHGEGSPKGLVPRMNMDLRGFSTTRITRSRGGGGEDIYQGSCYLGSPNQ